MKHIRSWPYSRASVAALSSLYLWSHAVAAELHVPSEYPTIRTAVDAAQPGDIVRIAAGDYYEQAVITNKTNLTVVGEPGTVLHASENMSQSMLRYNVPAVAILGIWRSDVKFYDLVFEGHRLADVQEGPFRAILFRGSGGHIRHCTFRGFRGAHNTPAAGVVVGNVLSDGARVVDIDIADCGFTDNKLAMAFWGDDASPSRLRIRVVVEGSTIRGPGASSDIATTGIHLSTGTSGEVRRNSIVDHVYAGDDDVTLGVSANDGTWWTRGFHYPLRPVRFEGNTFSNNNVHLGMWGADGAEVVNNIFETANASATFRALVVSGANIAVANNNFSGAQTGIVLLGGEMYDHIRGPDAINPRLSANWFANVATPMEIQPDVTGMHQEGTKLSGFEPTFQSIRRSGTNQSLTLSVRCWHGVPLTLESLKDLSAWNSVITNTAPLPNFEFTEPLPPGTAHLFYRLRGHFAPPQ